VVEVVSGATRLDDLARAGTEFRVPNLRIIASSALFRFIDVIADASAVTRFVMLLIVAMLEQEVTWYESSAKRMSTISTCLDKIKFCSSTSTHFIRVCALQGSGNCSNT